ncbi:hypothetical protein [Dyadobacter crusticola]|uniref:hypothetical protein n=1 Tax=Dyadobacter crusticola TaxID=292407 RepID=UPI00054EA42E|nr:hypothetical protein [Dyadobacter crusticola]
METYRCLDTINPTIEQLQLWAYDLDLYLTEQDEDLILHSNQYLPALLQFACDCSCPKKEYCFSILEHHVEHLLSRRDIKLIDEAAVIISQIENVTDTGVLEWRASFYWISELIASPRKLNFEEMQEIASFLIGTTGETPILTTVTISGYFQFEQTFEVYTDYLYINPSTSDWKYSHRLPISI